MGVAGWRRSGGAKMFALGDGQVELPGGGEESESECKDGTGGVEEDEEEEDGSA